MHTHEHCLEATLLPSGRVTLACSHTGLPVAHLGDGSLFIEHLSHDPSSESYVLLKANLRVPLRCDSGERLSLVGGFASAGGCNCPAPTPAAREEGAGE